jgi:hypothetical protein
MTLLIIPQDRLLYFTVGVVITRHVYARQSSLGYCFVHTRDEVGGRVLLLVVGRTTHNNYAMTTKHCARNFEYIMSPVFTADAVMDDRLDCVDPVFHFSLHRLT